MESLPASAWMDRRIMRGLSPRDGDERERISVESGSDAGGQRRPWKHDQVPGRHRRTVTPVTPLTAGTVTGGHACREADFHAAVVIACRRGCRGIMVMVMAARFARHRLARMRHALTTAAQVARVPATAEGEVHHRGENCDDADKRSHWRASLRRHYRPLLR